MNDSATDVLHSHTVVLRVTFRLIRNMLLHIWSFFILSVSANCNLALDVVFGVMASSSLCGFSDHVASYQLPSQNSNCNTFLDLKTWSISNHCWFITAHIYIRASQKSSFFWSEQEMTHLSGSFSRCFCSDHPEAASRGHRPSGSWCPPSLWAAGFPGWEDTEPPRAVLGGRWETSSTGTWWEICRTSRKPEPNLFQQIYCFEKRVVVRWRHLRLQTVHQNRQERKLQAEGKRNNTHHLR